MLYSAVKEYGVPEAIFTDGGGVSKASQAKAVYRTLGITKREIERGQAWQSYIETAFNTQRRMADYCFVRAESFEELVAAHDRFVADYNLVEALGEDGWLKALKVSEYALHKPRLTQASQRRHSPLAEAL